MIRQTSLQIFKRFLRFGMLAWGGPVAQIAMIRQELVEEEKWVSKEKFNKALAVYQVLPGPEAHELCVYFGMLAGGRWGAFLAGLGFMLPGFILMMLLTLFYITIGINSTTVQIIFTGFQVTVIALIVAAVQRLGKHAILNRQLLIICIMSFITFFCNVPFYIILPAAGISYFLLMKQKVVLTSLVGIILILCCIFYLQPEILNTYASHANTAKSISSNNTSAPVVFLIGLKAGLLTFGGAYTVIPFIQQDAVLNYNWMSNQQFLDGIALSGILPAPLIIFSTFVGYFGNGWPGAILITIGIFIPAFAFTMIGHNLMEKLIEHKYLHNFLEGVTAGVIGIMAFTAFQLLRNTITDAFAVILFILCLLIIIKIKSKFTSAMVILGAGLVSFIFSRF